MEKWPVLHLSSFDPDQENYFYANTFSDHIQQHHLHVLTPHKHAFYVCVCFTRGSGWHEIDFRKYEIGRGSMFVLSPGQTHNWQFTPDTEGYVILHSVQFLHSASLPQRLPFFRLSNRVNSLILEETRLKELIPYFESALKDYRDQNPFFRQICASFLSLIYYSAARTVTTDQSEDRASEWYLKVYNRFIESLEKEYKSEHSVQFYADKLGISTRQLNRICAAVTGNTAGGTITNKILLESQTLLAGNKHELLEISDFLGFNEYSYFSRWFKKQTGISPLQFRAKYRTNSG